MTWQAKADNAGLRQRLCDLEQAREDKQDIHESEGRDGRGQWDRRRDPTPWCCCRKPAKFTPSLPSALTTLPQTTLLLASPAPSRAVSRLRLWTRTCCTPRCLHSAQAEATTEAETSLPAEVIALLFPLVLKKGLTLAEVKPQPEVCGLCHMQNSMLIFTLPRSTER